MKLDAIHELITAAIPSPYTHFIEGKHLHRVEVDPTRRVIMVDRFTYSVDVLAGGLITAPGTCISIAETSPGHLTVTQRRIAQCPHGEPLASGCRDCEREHREATA